ncbi:fatty acid conjugase, partial [Cantharellus anzutake]|uniref:fatty acid conjugase n=1 Tax=Cantharellus anzutake TaxID=1750568 RepID=UPI0019032BF9
RASKPYAFPKTTLKDIHDAVPKWCHEKKTFTSLYYVGRTLLWGTVFFTFAMCIPTLTSLLEPFGPRVQWWAKAFMWTQYWWWQSMVGCGIWTLAHEAGHMTLSPYPWVCHAIGWTLHCLVLVPYYGWRYSHALHHKATNSIERDENFCPSTRSDFGLPPQQEALPSVYEEILQEAPIVVFFRVLLQQVLGLEAYLIVNALGNRSYPKGTNHYLVNSPLFKTDASKTAVLGCNIGMITMLYVLYRFAKATSWGYLGVIYFVPWFLTNHWIVALVFLQHTDPTVPHYRKGAWTFLRGATCTIDRPLLGWMGRYFLHNISHDHVAHHFFSQIPFYHQPYVTQAIKKVLGDDYCYDGTNTYRSIWRNFTQCQFVEDEGDVVFYRDRKGVPTRVMEGSVGNGVDEHEGRRNGINGTKVEDKGPVDL